MERSQSINQTKLELYLGFLHSVQYGKPSLVCDFMELYRYIIDDFLVEYCRNLKPNDFMVKAENLARTKQGKREYLNNKQTQEMLKILELRFQSQVEIPRIKHRKKQSIETLIDEESLILAKFIRNETKEWNPRIPFVKFSVET